MNFQELRDLQYKEYCEIAKNYRPSTFGEPELVEEFNGLKAYRGGGLARDYFFLFQNDELICCFHAHGGYGTIYSPEEYLEDNL